MFFAIIPTVVYEVLGAQAALLTDCSLATYGRSGTAARPKWPLGLGLATDWPLGRRHSSARACPQDWLWLALAGSGWPWLSQGSFRPTVRPAVVASKADVTACGHPTSYCYPAYDLLLPHYELLLPHYDLLLPRLRATAAPPMAVQANPPSRRSVCGARAVLSAPTVRCSS